MNNGHIEQVGAPKDVYEDPETLYVADFLGVSNLMEATIVEAGTNACHIALDSYELETRGTDGDVTGEAKIVIRPERIELEEHGSPPGPNCVPAMVERVVRRLDDPGDRPGRHRGRACVPNVWRRSWKRSWRRPAISSALLYLDLTSDELRCPPS